MIYKILFDWYVIDWSYMYVRILALRTIRMSFWPP
jgi:hypothetical protein